MSSEDALSPRVVERFLSGGGGNGRPHAGIRLDPVPVGTA
jgi:hypothetical protein